MAKTEVKRDFKVLAEKISPENVLVITVYGTYEKAYAKFKELIADEMNPDNSWVGELEWKDCVLQDDKIELDFLDRRNDTDETECYWLITDTWNYGVHTFISIEIREVLE